MKEMDKAKLQVATALLLVAALTCGASELDFDVEGVWSFKNYHNRLTIEKDAVIDGIKCLAVRGPAKKCDTAFAALSRQIAIAPGSREFVLSVETKGSKVVADGRLPRGEWDNEIAWFAADGRKLGAQVMAHVAVASKDRFVLMREWGRIPEGASHCTIRFAFDSPNIHGDDAVFYRKFSLETIPAGSSRAAEFEAAWKDGAWIRNLLYPPLRREVPKAVLRDDGIALVDGKPFFPIGIYAVCRREFNGNNFDRAFSDLKAAGFNFAHTYGNAYDRSFLEAAGKYGFKLWVASRLPDRQLLDVGRHNSSIIAWYVGDDTANWQTPQEVMDVTTALKAVDPNRLTCQADEISSYAPVSRYASYVRATDVFMPEIYPVRWKQGDPSDTNCVAIVISDMERVRSDVRSFGDGRPRACWPIIQYFTGWGAWGHFPSEDQLRAMSWAAIVHGAHGITWYTYGGFEDKKKGTRNEGVTSTPERWRAISGLATQIRRLSPVLLERTPSAQPTVSIVDGPALDPMGIGPSVSCLLKRRNGKNYLFAVNAAPEPVTARFTMPGGSVRTERFKPFGVLLPEFKDGQF